MKKHVIFDIGNVLLHWAPHEVIAQHFPEVTDPHTLGRDLFYHPLWKNFDKGLSSSEQVRQDMAEYLNWSVADADKLIHACKQSLRAKEETIELVQALHTDNHRLFCLSNMPVEFFEYLSQAHDFWHYFEHITISGEIEMIKPDAEIYHHVLNTNNLTAQDCIFLDDLTENTQAAEQVGIHGVHFTDVRTAKAKMADLLMPS